jgi:hypothetical protein
LPEKETRARENQDRRHRQLHARSVPEKSDGQKEKRLGVKVPNEGCY